MKIVKRAVRRVYWLFLLLPLSACFVGLQDRGVSNFPIQRSVILLDNDGEPLAQALRRSGLFSELDNYPVSLIYVSQDAFAAYLDANGLSEAEFLAHPRLEAFLGTLIVPDASIGAPFVEEGTFETSAGTTIVTSNKTSVAIGGGVELDINGVSPESCRVQVRRNDTTATICFVTVPPSEFTW